MVAVSEAKSGVSGRMDAAVGGGGSVGGVRGGGVSGGDEPAGADGQRGGVSAGVDRAGGSRSRLSRWSSGSVGMLTIRACSSFWQTVRGIPGWLSGRSVSGSCRGLVLRRGCWMTRGFRRTGSVSPGVKRQYSGTLGKTGNCQIGVSVHAVGRGGRCRWGGRCICPRTGVRTPSGGARRRSLMRWLFKTKPELGVELVERAAGWEVAKAPVLGDHAYGENTSLRDRLDEAGCEYVLSVSPQHEGV